MTESSPPQATILVVDDNLANRLLLTSQLESAGYQVWQASHGPAGIEIATQQHPDLILLDVMMPGMSGFEVCAHLKRDRRTAAIPIIIVTTLRDVENRIQGIEAGADEFLSRPYHREELAVRVRSLIQLKRARERLEEERLAQERQEKQRLKETFGRYLGPTLVEEVLSREPGLLARRERRQAVVMFADLRGFTRLVMAVEPDTVIGLLNEYFTCMTEIAYQFQGTVFDLAGDEILVGFNVPFDQPDAPQRAVLTAVTMQRRFNELRQRWFGRLGTAVGLGVGVDQGEVVVGNVGAETRMNFAMVGEAVNTAHRLMEIAEDAQVIISESVYNALSETAARLLRVIPFEAMGEVALKGKTRPQPLYRTAVTRTSSPPAPLPSRERGEIVPSPSEGEGEGEGG
ncbi:MAG: response regulator [Chloroflexota bacterium]